MIPLLILIALRQAEIDQKHLFLIRRVHQHVLKFNVTVDKSQVMEGFDPIQDLKDVTVKLEVIQLLKRYDFLERGPDEIHQNFSLLATLGMLVQGWKSLFAHIVQL